MSYTFGCIRSAVICNGLKLMRVCYQFSDNSSCGLGSKISAANFVSLKLSLNLDRYALITNSLIKAWTFCFEAEYSIIHVCCFTLK